MTPNGFVDAVNLLLAALVAPDQRGPDHLVRVVEQDETVHLTGQADALHVATCGGSLRQYSVNRGLGGGTPILRTLLGPQRLLHSHVLMRSGKGVFDTAVFAYQEGARAARSDIDSEPIGHLATSNPKNAAPKRPASLPRVAFSIRVLALR